MPDKFTGMDEQENIESILNTIDSLLAVGGMDILPVDAKKEMELPRSEITPEKLKEMGFQEAQLNEILLGQEQGLAVEIYTKPCYNWKQMREIRVGLIEGIETYAYEDPMFSWEQMHEIRLGLLDRINTRAYASLALSATDMRKERLKLTAEAYKKNPTGYARSVTDEDAGLTIRFSDDYLIAYATLSEDNTGRYSAADMLKLLEKREVVYGYLQANIEQLASESYDGKEIEVARGKKAIVGKDGYYEFLFNEMLPGPPKETQDGKVDYREVRVAEAVLPGQLLAVYHQAGAGRGGETVNGIVIDAVDGKNLPSFRGKNIRYNAEESSYIATIKGYVSYDSPSYELNVNPVYIVNGDVNRYNGNIEYDGTIYVRGTVSEMATIRATGDIVIDGFVEGANLYAGQNVMIRCGINAGGKGIVDAKGRIMAEFFESAKLHAGGTIEGNYFLNCDIETDAKVIARGSKSSIIGGRIIAAVGIESAKIGNVGKKKAIFEIGDLARLDRRAALVEKEVNKIDDELMQLNDGRRKLHQMFGNNVDGNEIFQRVCTAIAQKEEELQGVRKELERLKWVRDQAVFAYAKIYVEVQEDVHIIINGKRKAFTERSRGVLLTAANILREENKGARK